MATAERKRTYTPEDLLAMPDGVGFELIDGHLVERDVGAISSWVGGLLYHLLLVHCRTHDLGWVWPADNGYQCFPDRPNKVRKPDVSFVRKGRLPGEELPEGFITIAPDLAVEVISPNELAYEVDEKVLEYLAVGVRLVWVVNPASRIVMVYRADGSVSRLGETDQLDGEDVLPGFRCPIAAVLPPAPA